MNEDQGGDETVDANDALPPPGFLTDDRGIDASSASAIHQQLANDRRRRLLSVLLDHPDDTVRVDEVVDGVTERERPDPGPASHRERVAIDLHHAHLPKLADAGVIEMDPVEGTVRYDGPEALSTMLELTNAFERSSVDEE